MATNDFSLCLNSTRVIPDIGRIIFSLCPISDKRNLTRTCKNNYILAQYMRFYEKQLKKMINDSNMLDIRIRFTRFDNLLYKYTLELMYDNYYHLIPDRYFCQQNRIMFMYPRIYKRIAYSGNLIMLQKMLTIRYVPDRNSNYEKISIGAALGNHLNILEYMINNGYNIDPDITSFAAARNHFELLKQLVDKGFRINCATISKAIMTGNEDMIQWLLLKKRVKNVNNITGAAVEKNMIDIIEYLHDKYKGELTEICNQAIFIGNINVLKWGLRAGYEITKRTYSDMKYGGHVYILEWLKENNYLESKTTHLTTNAVFAGNLDVLKWAKRNDFPFHPQTWQRAAEGNHFEILKWGADQGFHMNDYVADYAAYYAAINGNKEMLKWCLDRCLNHEFKLKKDLCFAAAWHGRISLIKWLYKKGYELSDKIWYIAASNGHLNILNWAHDNNIYITISDCSNICINNNIDILKWLCEKSYTLTSSNKLCRDCIYGNNVEILNCMTTIGFKWNKILHRLLWESKEADIIEWRETNISKFKKFIRD